MRVTIVGAGRMARGIGTRVLAGGHELSLLDRDEEEARELAAELSGSSAGAATASGAALSPEAISGEVVVLAVPYAAVADVLRHVGAALRGKVVVDITNPLNQTYDGLATPPGRSAAEETQALVGPDARVVKAFNTTFANTLVEGQVAGQPLDVFVAGDDAAAKAVVARLASDGALHPVDVGPLERARQLEQIGFLGIMIQQPLGLGFRSGWKLLLPQS
jgi:NADPH-dependent F420 reductase